MSKTGDVFSLIDWMRFLEEEDIIMSFKGEFNQELINAILLLSTNKDHLNAQNNVVKNRVFSIIVECLQNICKHGADDASRSEIKPGIILISKEGHTVYISTGNLILNEEVDSLMQKIDHLKSLNIEEIKALSKKTMLTATLSAKSGAGLGLITIAKKSKKIAYEIKKINEQISFFSLEASISTIVN